MTFKSSLLIIILTITLFGGIVGLQLLKNRQNIAPKAGGETPATLEDYWQGRADWKLVNKITRDTPFWKLDPDFVGGTQIIANDGSWYLFSRRARYSDRNEGVSENCKNQLPLGNGEWVSMGTVVRKSTDQGASWTDPVDIIIPTIGKPWECSATDGSAFYDSDQNKWHYMFQCMDGNGGWDGCELEKDGADPMGLFQETHSNPVMFESGPSSPWTSICTPGKDCYTMTGGRPVTQAGTFDIISKIDGYYYVSFHGTDDVYGFRGIAKTQNFLNWIAGDPAQGVPADAVLDKNDQSGWRESWDNPVGAGASSTLFDNGYYYQIAEFTQITFGDFNTKWDWGIFRSNSLASTSWEQFPQQNPFFYSQNNYGNLGYGHLFKDNQTQKIYLSMAMSPQPPDQWHSEWGLFIYELQTNTNILQNGNLWKCNTDNWNTNSNTANQAVYRNAEKSSDGRCYLEFNCVNDSCNGASVYQDIDVSNLTNRNLEYGGKFSVAPQSQGTGKVELVFWELMNGQFEHGPTVPISITGQNYQEFKGNVLLDPQTKIVRFEWYIQSPQTMRADELFVTPTLEAPTPPASPAESPPASPVASPVESPPATPIASPQGRIGDVNGDGVINILDVGLIVEHYGEEGANIIADPNKDGRVNILDIGQVIENYDR